MWNQQSRRTFLKAGAPITLCSIAGCTSSSSGEYGDNGDPQTPSWETILNERTEVEEDEYQAWNWSPDQSAELQWEFTVRDGPSVEFFFMKSTEFDEYQAQNRFYVIESGTGTSDTERFTVDSGNYRLVLDNTSAGDVQPPTNFVNDEAEVEIEVEAKSI